MTNAPGFAEAGGWSPEPAWVTAPEALAIHAKQIDVFGGAPGLRDGGLLDSALSRPVNAYAYGTRDLADLAVAAPWGVLRDHPFVDGNKRVAFVTLLLFLRKNGVPFRPPQAESVWMIRSVSAGETSDRAFARWVRDRWPEKP